MPFYAVTYIFEAEGWGQAVKLDGYARMELQPVKTPMLVELTNAARF